jgi:stringent starvation protein B
MSPVRPYLLRAMYQWIVDNGYTPYILVNAQDEAAEVPTAYVKDGKIVLNIAPMAVQELLMDNEWLSFNARFSGKAMSVMLPMRAILAIFAHEAGDKGMVFQPEDFSASHKPMPTDPSPPPTSTPPTGGGSSERKKPVLKVIK